MRIPDPAALPGQRINVLNYRKRPAAWESGIVGAVEFTLYGEDHPAYSPETLGRWHYCVWIERPIGEYSIMVGDDAVSRGERRAR